MASKTYRIKGVGSIHGFDLVTDAIEVHVSMEASAGRIARAHSGLKADIMASMLYFMPFLTGDFQRRTRAANMALIGTDEMYAGVGPMGGYLYHGKVMVNAATGKGPGVIPGVGPRYRQGTKLRATSRPLNLTRGNPNAQPYWYDEAKARDLDKWVDAVQRILDGK